MLLKISYFIACYLWIIQPLTAQKQGEKSTDQYTMNQLDSIVDSYKKNKLNAKTLPFAQELAKKTKLKYGEKDSSYAYRLYQLGDALIYNSNQNYSEAITTYQAAQKIYEDLSIQSLSYAKLLLSLAEALSFVNQYKGVENLYLTAKKIHQRKLSEDEVAYADLMSRMAIFYEAIGRYALVEKYHLKAKEIYEQALGKENRKYLGALNNIAIFYEIEGRYEEAEKHYLEALTTYEKMGKGNTVAYAHGLNNLAYLYESMEKYEGTEKLYLTAQKIYAAKMGKKSIDYGDCLNNLGVLYQTVGRYEESKFLYLEVQDIYKKELGKEHIYYADLRINQGDLYNSMLDYSASMEAYFEARKIYEKVLGPKHANYGSLLNNMAVLYRNMKNYKGAEELYKEAEAIFEANFGREHIQSFYAKNNLASLYDEMERYSMAEKYYLEAAEICLLTVGKRHRYVTIQNNLAQLYLDTKEYEKAWNYSEHSLQLNLGDSIDFDAPNWNLKLAATPFQWTGAAERALGFIYTLLGIKGAPVNQRKVADLALWLLVKQQNRYSNKSSKLTAASNATIWTEKKLRLLTKETTEEDALSLLEFNKSVLLKELINRNKAYNIGVLPDSLHKKEKNINERIEQLEASLAKKLAAEKRTEQQSELNTLNIELNAFKQRVETLYPQYHALKFKNNTASIKEVQEELAEKTAMIEYFITDSTTYMIVVSKKDALFVPISISKKILNQKINLLHRALSNYQVILKDEKRAYEEYTKVAYWFYQTLLQPAKLEEKALNKLILVVDGELGHLPFETFLTKAPQQGVVEYKNLHYLIKEYAVSYNYSATLWLENLKNKPSQNNRQTLACAATYNGVDSMVLNQRSIGDYKLRNSLNPIPATKQEVMALGERMEGEFLVGMEANEAYFKKNATNYAVIHLAMHGILNKNAPNLSSLAFTENEDSLENNFLQAYEISQLNLNADLVVLSACETGYGKFKQGEGILSLARSFMYAGTPSLIVSLWQVNDQSTALIMQRFYHYLSEGKEKDIALQQAKLTYIEDAEGLVAHPAFWSPFISLGDAKAINLKAKQSWILPFLGTAFLGLVIISGWWFRKRKQ